MGSRAAVAGDVIRDLGAFAVVVAVSGDEAAVVPVISAQAGVRVRGDVRLGALPGVRHAVARCGAAQVVRMRDWLVVASGVDFLALRRAIGRAGEAERLERGSWRTNRAIPSGM